MTKKYDEQGELLTSFAAAVTVTRPANTTAYTAGDVIGVADASVAANAGSAILEFTDIGPPGGHILINSVSLLIALAAIPASMTSFRLHLYGTSPTAILDNAVWDLPAGDQSTYRGFIDLGSPADLGSTLFVQTESVNKQLKLAPNSTSLFGQLVTAAGYTPTSGGVLTVKLHSKSA